MKKFTTIFILTLLLCSAHSTSAQTNEAWHSNPYEVTFGTNLGTREFSYDEYSFGTENENTLITNTLQTPSFNVGVLYKLSKHISLGAIATYAQSNFVNTATYDTSTIHDDRCRYMSLAPRIRFDWLNRKYVTLYSSFALGVGFTSEKDRISGDVNSETTPYAEATFIGVKVGRKIFGFADLAASSTGAMRVGVGYNFDFKR